MVRLRWLFREAALRRWIWVMMEAMRVNNSCAARLASHHDCTSAAAAVRTWQTVKSGFFPPPLLVRASQEQVRDGSDCLMSHQAHVRAALEMVEAQLCFFVLEAAFHTPPREGHDQQHAQRRFRRRMRDEELDLLRFHYDPGQRCLDRGRRGQ